MDLLSDILSTLRLRGNLYFRTDLSKPWGIYVPADRNIARFHVVINGNCWIGVGEESEPFFLSEGDLAVIPHGNSHRLMDTENAECLSLEEVLTEKEYTGEGVLHYGGAGSKTTLVCGYFSFDEDIVHPLLETLPEKIHVKGNRNLNFMWLDKVLGFIGNESETGNLGARAILERLSEILFIQVIRAYSNASSEKVGYLAALGDAHISRALKRIHREPERKWTLQELSRVAGLSRTSFAERFKALMGVPAIEYVTNWRMSLALATLKNSQKTIVEIGEEIGYQSEASFSTAFKRQFGKPPSLYRNS